MRGKRSKQYRKLMQQYAIAFGFREPFQVLLDAEIIRDAARFKMDLIGGLERTLHGKVKPMITQCSIRHLYNDKPPDPGVIDQAKTYERRRCNHHTLNEPLSSLECLKSVVDQKASQTNKHRYVIASDTMDVREHMRTVLGVPLVYITRSVMIMEPMAGTTAITREREEKAKFRAGIKTKGGGEKRKREDELGAKEGVVVGAGQGEPPVKKKKKEWGKKGPNPLSVKKPKKKEVRVTEANSVGTKRNAPEISTRDKHNKDVGRTISGGDMEVSATSDPKPKTKRKRKHARATDSHADVLKAAGIENTVITSSGD